MIQKYEYIIPCGLEQQICKVRGCDKYGHISNDVFFSCSSIIGLYENGESTGSLRAVLPLATFFSLALSLQLAVQSWAAGV